MNIGSCSCLSFSLCFSLLFQPLLSNCFVWWPPQSQIYIYADICIQCKKL
uniref:Uncharacterized protein n=1 Tax=Anguilla anguilla TaxID=7936 RepID=A0A0E9XDY2_ANGAN